MKFESQSSEKPSKIKRTVAKIAGGAALLGAMGGAYEAGRAAERETGKTASTTSFEGPKSNIQTRTPPSIDTFTAAWRKL